MGKEEMQKLGEIVGLIKNMQSQINFLQVQMGSSGGGGGGRQQGQQTSQRGGGGGASSIDPKQLQALEQRLHELMEVETRNNEMLVGLREDLARITSGKIEQADERLNQVTRLLEQGLQLTEMGTQLTELRDRMEEAMVRFEIISKEEPTTE